MNDLVHNEIIDLLAAYALDAVDPDEVVIVEQHLQQCARCASELDTMREVVGLIANSGGDARPELWESIAARLDGPSPPSASSPAARRFHPMSAGQSTRRIRSGRRISVGALRTGAVAAALVLIAVLGIQVARLDHRVGQLQAAGAQQAITRAANSALSDPQARRVTLRAARSSGSEVAEIAVMPSGTAFLVNESLPRLPADQTYQLWGEVGEQLVSLGLLGDAPSVVAFHVDPSGTITVFAVTVEQAGGVVRTTHTPVAVSLNDD